MLTFKAIYAVIVGIYLGDCVTTAIVCSIGAEADAKRVGIVNILFNLSETVLVLAGVAVVHRMGLLDGLWDSTVNSGIIANTNTVFNLTCAVCLFPMLGLYERTSRKIVKDAPKAEGKKEKYRDKLEGLNPAFFNVPALALNGCYELLLTIFAAARNNLEKSFRLLEAYDETVYQEILDEEDEIDRMTDRISRYTMELLPRLQLEYHVKILDEYYKLIPEFEQLGDHAVSIAKNAAGLARHQTAYSDAALRELRILEEAVRGILDLTESAFRSRNIEAAREIEPRVQAIHEIISALKKRHLKRIRAGAYNMYADANFTSLMTDFKRVASVCSNVGVATVVRVYLYYERLRSGDNEGYNAAFQSAHDRYFALLDADDTPS